jgi:DNA-binding NtrC family response regulator
MSFEEVKTRLQQESFDAMIIDGKMPNGWNAPDVHRWIIENRAGLEKHLMFTFSGAVDPEIRAFLQNHNVPYLVKPFEVGDLISHARRLLQKTLAASGG